MSQPKYSLPPLKSLGQNFLRDRSIIDKILEAARLNKSDIVLEIGPGHGELTLPLARKVAQVTAVELDRGLARNLTVIVPKNVRVIHADACRLDLAQVGLAAGKYIVVANLPFNSGAAIMRHLLAGPTPPDRLLVILQAEVVARILAKDQKESLLSLAVKFYGRSRQVFLIPATAYSPQPRVETALLEISVHKSRVGFPPPLDFFKIIRAGFSARRKYLASNLVKNQCFSSEKVKQVFSEIGLSPRVRAEDLAFEDWLKLSFRLDSACGKG